VTTIEEGARAAMRAVAQSVTDAPALRLEPARPGTGPARRISSWLAPLAAAAAVVAIALSVVLLRIHPNGHVVPPTPSGSVSVSVPAGAVPRYFVEIDPTGQWTTSANDLLVADTYTGKTVATVAPPAGMTFQSVSAASDDRTFVLYVTPYTATWSTGLWYELRIAPGTAHPATLTRLPISPLPDVQNMAVSESGTELAVVQTGTTYPELDTLSLYSLATGHLLHAWTTRYGSRVLPYFATNTDGPIASWPTLTWIDGDRRIAYLGDPSPSYDGHSLTWTMRQLDVTAAGSSLQTDSKVVWTEQTPNSERDKYGCDLGNPLAMSPGGRTFVCTSGTSGANGEKLMKWLVYPTGANSRGRLLYQTTYQNKSEVGSGYGGGMSDDDDEMLWTNQSGSVLIVLWWDFAGDQIGDIHFGVISNGRFSPLPASLITAPTEYSQTSIAW
jgi:hypothetical protein